MTWSQNLRQTWLRGSLLMAAVCVGTLPGISAGQELPWLSGGQVRLDFTPRFWTWDSRYGIGPSGADEEELLGSDLNSQAFGSGIIPGLADLDASLAAALEDPTYRVNLGVSRAFMDQSRLVIPFHLEIGITDWLTVGGMVPLVRPRTELTFALHSDSITATEGASPLLTDPTNVSNFLGAFDAVLQAAEAAHPGESAVEEARSYYEALTAAYGHGTFFPVDGSQPGADLQNRLEEIRGALTGLGISGLPNAVPLARDYLTEEDFGRFVGGNYMRAAPLTDYTTPWAMGDVELTASLRLLSGGLEPDSAGVFPSFRYQLGGGALVRLGTGKQQEPLRFFDQNIGDGQMDVEGSVFGMVEWGSRLGAWARARYGVQSEGDLVRRITPPTHVLPEFGRTYPVTWDPGDYLEFEVNPRIFLNPSISFGVRYRYWSKGEDSYSYATVFPDGMDLSVVPTADLLNAETEQKLQEAGFSATYSTLDAYARGEASMPLFIRATYFRPISGSGGQTPKGGRFEAGLTIFKTLWGGPDKSGENAGDVGGGGENAGDVGGG